MTLYKWSKTAATNSSADSTINWAEGQAPSSVNDSARAEMAAVAKYRDDVAGSLTTGGSSSAYTLTTNEVFDSLAHLSGQTLKVRFNAANDASPTLNVDGLGAKAIQVASGTAVGAGVIGADSIWGVTYDNSIPAFILTGVPALVQTNTVGTTSIAASAVTYAKIQNVADQKLLGNFSGGAAAPSEYSVTGPRVSGSSIAFPGPVPATYKNLVIKVATTTTVTVTADFVATTDGTNFQATAVSSTINLGTTGADALDAGTIATDTWYYIWVIAKSDGTTKCLASTSSSSPTLPSGYTYKARVGAVQTIHASATLYGTWQFNNRAQYVVGLAQTANLPIIQSSSTGTLGSDASLTAVSVAANGKYVPPTASTIRIVAKATVPGSAGVDSVSGLMVAPNNNYGKQSSLTNPVPIMLLGSNAGGQSTYNNVTGEITLEGTSIYVAIGSNGSGVVACLGWEDNI